MLTDFIYYDLKVAALIAVFYLFYRLLLARETMHRLNRAVLLAGIVLSVVLPLCIITIHEKPHPQPLSDWRGEYIVLPIENETTKDTTPLFNRRGAEGEAVSVILLAGIFLRLFFLARSYGKLNRLIRSGERHTLPSGIQLSVVDAPVAPFSWMQTIVLSRADWLSQSESILAHEEAHVRHRHSYDVVVVEVLTALQWFNPVVWFLRQELRILHEYQADASVLSRGFDESQYIHLLMQKATGIQACALANGIHTPQTKKRILMMLKTKSKWSAQFKALYIVPIVLASLVLSAETVIDYETVTRDDTPAVRLFNEKNNGRGESYQIRRQPGVKFFRNGKEEQIPEGRSIALEVKKTTMQVNGKPIDQLTLLDMPAGELKEVHLNETASDRYVCNLLTEVPSKKTAYIVNGKQVSEEAVGKIPQEDVVSVTTIGSRKTVKNALHVEADDAVVVETEPVFEICEQLPQFPGGEVGLMKWLAQNIKYPKQAIEYGVQGRVFVQFIVEKDGSLSNFTIVDSPKSSGANMVVVNAQMTDKQRKDAETHNAGVRLLREEAIRVVKAMPKWTPGKQKGKVVRCKFLIPVTYRLN
jgi:hypothetical protein